jgi:hypothetical protein
LQSYHQWKTNKKKIGAAGFSDLPAINAIIFSGLEINFCLPFLRPHMYLSGKTDNSNFRQDKKALHVFVVYQIKSLIGLFLLPTVRRLLFLAAVTNVTLKIQMS